jgi:hypothetical protein
MVLVTKIARRLFLLLNWIMKLGRNFVIFIIFFGAALVEAGRVKNWPLAILFAFLGILFLFAGKEKKK